MSGRSCRAPRPRAAAIVRPRTDRCTKYPNACRLGFLVSRTDDSMDSREFCCKLRKCRVVCILFVLPSLALGIGLLCASPVQAGLGKDAADILVDSAQMHGVVEPESRPQYEIQEITDRHWNADQ